MQFPLLLVVMNKSYKSVSVWFNHSGIDECYYEKKNTKFDSKFLKLAGESVDFLAGVPKSEFYVEEKGKGWVMYGFDGIGILCSDIGKLKAHSEYTVLMNGEDESGW